MERANIAWIRVMIPCQKVLDRITDETNCTILLYIIAVHYKQCCKYISDNRCNIWKSYQHSWVIIDISVKYGCYWNIVNYLSGPKTRTWVLMSKTKRKVKNLFQNRLKKITFTKIICSILNRKVYNCKITMNFIFFTY